MITHQDIEKLFGELLSRIKDKNLARKVVDTWVLGCSRGHWETIEALKKMPFTLLVDTHPIGFVEHTIAVTAGAIGLARAQMENYSKMPYEIDFESLIAGALLHDIGKLLEYEPDGKGGYRQSYNGKCARHPISGAILASEVGLSDKIINMIACHAEEGRGRPQRIETVLIHQADFATFNPFAMAANGKLIAD